MKHFFVSMSNGHGLDSRSCMTEMRAESREEVEARVKSMGCRLDSCSEVDDMPPGVGVGGFEYAPLDAVGAHLGQMPKPDQEALIRLELEGVLFSLWERGATTAQLAAMCEDIVSELTKMAHEREAAARKHR